MQEHVVPVRLTPELRKTYIGLTSAGKLVAKKIGSNLKPSIGDIGSGRL